MSALAQPTFVSVDEYLRTSYNPDCEYVDGVIEERNLGEYEHSVMQGFFTILFAMNRKTWNAKVFPEYHVQFSPTASAYQMSR